MSSLPLDVEWKAMSLLADYQFGKGAGKALFPRRIEFTYSRYLRRPKTIFDEMGTIATLSTKTGTLVLSLEGAKRLHKKFKPPRLRVVVQKEVGSFIREGKSAFCKHVRGIDGSLRPGDEVLVVDESDHLLGYGRLLLPPELAKGLKRGVATKVRGGLALEQKDRLR